MPETAHEKRLKKIEAETLEIKKQIMQLEFQNKKDIVASQKRLEEWSKERKEWDILMTKKIQHIAQLAGIAYEELDNLDLKVQEAGLRLSKPRKPTTLA